MPLFIARAVYPSDLFQYMTTVSLSQQLDIRPEQLRKFRIPTEAAGEISAAVKADRNHFGAGRATRDAMVAAIAREFARWRWPAPRGGFDNFAIFASTNGVYHLRFSLST